MSRVLITETHLRISLAGLSTYHLIDTRRNCHHRRDDGQIGIPDHTASQACAHNSPSRRTHATAASTSDTVSSSVQNVSENQRQAVPTYTCAARQRDLKSHPCRQEDNHRSTTVLRFGPPHRCCERLRRRRKSVARCIIARQKKERQQIHDDRYRRREDTPVQCLVLNICGILQRAETSDYVLLIERAFIIGSCKQRTNERLSVDLIDRSTEFIRS